VVKMLLSSGADVNHKNKYGWTALHWAAGNGHLKVVKVLLSFEADIHHKNKGGWTALHYAAHSGHLEVVKELMKSGARVEVDNNGKTPIDWATSNEEHEVASFLMAYRN
jgi:ankyrin repeat protein